MTQEEFTKRFTYNPTEDLLGEGGFGRVYKAYDNCEQEYVALKIQSVDPHYPNLRLRNEVEKVQQHNHKNIARYKDCYTFTDYRGETDVAIMTYYKNGSLDKFIATKELTLNDKYLLLTELLDGIAYLHSVGIIHRDLKPQNILIIERDGKYYPLITDFGISKKLVEADGSSVFNSIFAGTRAYASPEQLAEHKIRKNTDLWSFGVLAFQLLTGKLPFSSGSFSPTSDEGYGELSRQIKSGVLPDVLLSVEEPWQQVIRRCLVVDNRVRLAHTEDVFAILEGKTVITPNVGADATKIDPTIDNKKEDEGQRIVCQVNVESGGNGNKSRSSRRWILLSLLAVVVVGYFVIRPSEESTPKEESIPKSDIPPTLILNSATLVNFNSDGGNGSIEYTLSNLIEGESLSIECSDSWVTAVESVDKITYFVRENDDKYARDAKIKVSYADKGFEVSIHQDAKTYKIGDYYDENGISGVVVQTYDNGRHGLIVHKHGGCGNFFAALDFRNGLGDQWNFPTPAVYRMINNNMNTINNAIDKVNGTRIKNGIHWSNIAEDSYTGEGAYVYDMRTGDEYNENVWDEELFIYYRVVAQF